MLTAALCFSQEASGPWQKSEVLQPAQLAKILQSSGKKPTVICVAFPILYNSKHIAKAVYAGPGGRPEGIEALKKLASGLAKDTDIVLYCGCCPMERCPNIRPAYQALKQLGFTHVRILDVPTNMASDWYAKNYPSEDGPLGSGPAR